MVIAADLEKRVFQRMVINQSVTITQAQGNIEGTCRDLSANGMSIEVKKGAIAQGSKIHISLSAGDSRVPPLEATGSVVRTLTSPSNTENELIGVEFLTVS